MSPHQTGGSTPTATPTGTATGTATPPGSEYLPPVLQEILRNTPLWLVDALQSIVVLVIAYAVSRLLVRLLGRRIARHFRRPSLTRTVLRGIRVGVGVFALLTILGIYGYGLGDIALSVQSVESPSPRAFGLATLMASDTVLAEDESAVLQEFHARVLEELEGEEPPSVVTD